MTTIEPEVLSILKESKVTEMSLVLPKRQLERKLYEAVNRVLTDAGGRWDRKSRSHLFASDPRERLGLAIATGKSENQQQKFQAFFTPEDLAYRVAVLGEVAGHAVLEPSAGHGALADACMQQSATRVTCVEINPEFTPVLRKKGYEVVEDDFMKLDPHPEFDRVIMNPPFTRNADIKHVSHALRFLKSPGILVTIMAGNTNRPWFKNLQYAHTVQKVEAGAFRESGTNVNTVIVKIRV